MNIEIERGFNGAYLIIKDEDFDNADDELCMFLNNAIPGFIKASIRTLNGSECIYYDVSSMMPLTEIAKKQEFKYKEIKEVTKSLILAETSIEEYLLTDSGIIMKPEYVFYDTREKKIKYCFYPFYNRDVSESLNELAEFLLRSTDHSDKRAVKAVYELYSQIQKENYDFTVLFNSIKEEPVNNIKAASANNIKEYPSSSVSPKSIIAPPKPVKRRHSRMPVIMLVLITAFVLTAVLVFAVVCLDL